MGFKLDYENEMGIPINYWCIKEVVLHKYENYVDIKMIGFIDRQTRLDGKKNIKENGYTVDNEHGNFNEYFNLDKLDTTTENIYQVAYKYLKENELFFENAIDILEEEI